MFKAFTSYAATGRVTVSGYLRVQSGTPWAARGRDWTGTTALNYLEPAGSHRNPTWTNLDVMGAYVLPTRGRVNVSIEARVMNMFNNQIKLSTDAQQYLDLRTLPTPPYFAPYLQPNPFFSTGNSFAPPPRGRTEVLAGLRPSEGLGGRLAATQLFLSTSSSTFSSPAWRAWLHRTSQ